MPYVRVKVSDKPLNEEEEDREHEMRRLGEGLCFCESVSTIAFERTLSPRISDLF